MVVDGSPTSALKDDGNPYPIFPTSLGHKDLRHISPDQVVIGPAYFAMLGLVYCVVLRLVELVAVGL